MRRGRSFFAVCPGLLRYPENIRSRTHSAALFLALALTAGAQEADETWRDLIGSGQSAFARNQYSEAEEAYLKAEHEAERFGSDDWRVGTTLQGLGETYRMEKKIGEAEAALRRALAIIEKNNDDDSVEVASVNYDIGSAMLDGGRPAEAVIYARKALTAYQTRLGGTSSETGGAFCLLGDSLRSMRNFIDAEEPLRNCADIREAVGGIDSLGLADALHSLALTYVGEKKYKDADSRFSMAEKIREKKLGITSPMLAQTMEDHAALLKTIGRDREAARLTALASAIRRGEKKNTR